MDYTSIKLFLKVSGKKLKKQKCVCACVCSSIWNCLSLRGNRLKEWSVSHRGQVLTTEPLRSGYNGEARTDWSQMKEQPSQSPDFGHGHSPLEEGQASDRQLEGGF